VNIVEKRLEEIQPYENNPRRNDAAVPYVAESIRQYGFKVPIVIDKNGVIVAGHTRYLASISLGLETVPCIVADDLTDEQVREFRLVDNKTAEFSSWDFGLLNLELEGIDFEGFDYGFTVNDDFTFEDMAATEEEPKEEKSEETMVCPHCGKEFVVRKGVAYEI
jgi:site-specific DNA-methyltransferase (adenine-specific)